jgi:hypothetical protein
MKLQLPIGAIHRRTFSFERRRGIGAHSPSARSDRRNR